MAKFSDWNDIHCLYGLDEVRRQLTEPNYVVQEVVPLFPKGKGKNAKITEKDVCENLQAYFGDRVTKHKQDLFIYKDNYWQHLEEDKVDRIKQLISKLAPDYGINDIERALRYYIMQTPSPGVNMFQPNPTMANFQNGTLRVSRQGSGYRAEFGPHSPEDYLTSKLPFDFPGIPGEPGYRGEVNAEFEAMLRRIWEGDEDLEQKVRLYKQVLGACLIPMFPIIVLATGKPGSGKSTLIKIIRKLVSEENISTVDPSQFHGFLMENMVGKLLNIRTEIDLSTPMQDAMVKSIIDRLPVQVNRKNQKVINAFIPAVHIFAGNGLPKTLDGESRAYERRMIIIKTEKFQATGKEDDDFDKWVWDQNPEGIICAAVEGLFDLLKSNGKYQVLESGKKLVREMQNRNDPVAVFLAALNDGLLNDNTTHYRLAQEGKIDRSNLWELFSAWRQHEDRPTREMGRTHFYQAVEGKGHEVVTVKGIRKFKGIEAFEPDKANF